MTDPLALQDWISCLESERNDIELALANLRKLQERRHNGTSAILTRVVEASTRGRKRGRKFMAEEERQVVSERMKRYWASRRKLPCENCDGKGFLNLDGTKNNAFNGSDSGPFQQCPQCEGAGIQ